MQKKIFLFLILLSSFMLAQTIQTKSNIWNLVGTNSNITNLSSMNFNLGDAIWQYDEQDTQNPWKCYRHGENYITHDVCEPITSIEAGSGFWIYSYYDSNITINNSQENFEKVISDEWTLFSPVLKDYNISDINETNITAIWGYSDNNWTFWDEENTSNGYTKITQLKQSNGYWFYNLSKTKNIISDNIVSIGDEITALHNGNFQTVTKLSSDDIENIWNISFKIDTSKDYSNFQIGVKFFKRENDGSDDIGEFVYRNLSLTNSILTAPDMLVINGIGDSGSGGTYFDNSYDPNNMRNSSIVLENNTMTLKLGLVMKNQSFVKESTFKVIEDYDVFITSNVPIIIDSKPMNIEIINQSKYDFSNSNGIEGRIEIR